MLHLFLKQDMNYFSSLVDMFRLMTYLLLKLFHHVDKLLQVQHMMPNNDDVFDRKEKMLFANIICGLQLNHSMFLE